MLRLFRQLILRQLRSEVLRTAITVVGVAAGIAVVLAIRLTNASAVRGFEAALDLMSGRAGLEVLGAGFGLDGTGFKLRSVTVEEASKVPEPGALALLGLGLAGLGAMRRRKQA